MFFGLRRKRLFATPPGLFRRAFRQVDVTKNWPNDTCLTSECALRDRDLICVRNLTAKEIKEVVWTALELKCRAYDRQPMKLLQNRHVSVLVERRNLLGQMAATRAAKTLGAEVSTVLEPNLSKAYNSCTHLGPILSKNTDLLVIGTRYHSNLEQIAEHAIAPIINLTTDFQRPAEALSTLLTLLERFKYLRGLNVALIGYPNALFQSYLCSFPRLGINVKLSCRDAAQNLVSPRFFDVASEHCEDAKTVLLNCHTTREACQGADVVIAGPRGNSDVPVSLEKTFSCDWAFIQHFGRGPSDLNDYFVRHKNSLTYATCENLMYVYAAVMVKMLRSDYKHSLAEPNF